MSTLATLEMLLAAFSLLATEGCSLYHSAFVIRGIFATMHAVFPFPKIFAGLPSPNKIQIASNTSIPVKSRCLLFEFHIVPQVFFPQEFHL